MRLFKNLSLLSILLIALQPLLLNAQDKDNFTWWDPAKNTFVFEGQAWSSEAISPYDRLPARAQTLVRKPVWNLSRNSSGLIIRFKSNADKIVVKYQVTDVMSFPHMTSTGVSGLDLYAVNSKGEFLWCAGQYSFNDTVTYSFNGINPSIDYISGGFEYRLYLPLYNSVKWLKIGVPLTKDISAIPPRKEKPIVVYGTSIAQGACASRPGMAWTAILGRRLDCPVFNLGFSGNGMLEKEVIDLISEIDAKLFILDCLPNMTAPRFTDEEVKNRIFNAVRVLQEKRPGVPIIFSEHGGYSDGEMRPERYKNFNDINILMDETFSEMKLGNVENIFLFPCSEINLDGESQVDGIHPNDLGMYRYAEAYSKFIRAITGF